MTDTVFLTALQVCCYVLRRRFVFKTSQISLQSVGISKDNRVTHYFVVLQDSLKKKRGGVSQWKSCLAVLDIDSFFVFFVKHYEFNLDTIS